MIPARIGNSLASSLFAGMAVTATADTTQPAPYRIFLEQGEAVLRYGGYARVGDRVVFSLPLSVDVGRESAASGRHVAVQGGDLGAAWDSAAGAAGALMLFERASGNLERAQRQPKLN